MMHDPLESVLRSRREFLSTSASGVGGLALASLLSGEASRSAARTPDAGTPGLTEFPLAPRPPHFAPKAKNCIFFFMAGAPSQMDLFDPKPKLNEMHLQKLPASMLNELRFAFIQKETALLMGTKRTFKKYGECGMDFSDLLPEIGSCADDIAMIRSMRTEAFNHHPGQLMMNTGVMFFGRPSMGSWLTYGLGSESQNLPGYVVLTTGRGTSGGASNWGSGFLPSTYQGVLFRNQGEPILHLNRPEGVSERLQRASLDTLGELNMHRHRQVLDEEILSRISSYELAFRMQSAAPDLLDLSGESEKTMEDYGVNRSEGDMRNYEDMGKGEFGSFSRNCLLARRMVERGVRFVNIYHATWDHHQNINQGLEFNCRMCDQPIAALIRDLKQRGLLDTTLVVFAGEFGRTPLGENRTGRVANTGRDHHPYAFTLWMAGGGVKGGQIIGKTDELGWDTIEDPVHVNDFHATLLHLFGLDHLKLTHRHQGRDFRLTDVAGEVVHKLIA